MEFQFADTKKYQGWTKQLRQILGNVLTPGKTFEELVINGKFDPYVVLELDTILISSIFFPVISSAFNRAALEIIAVPC